MSCDFELQPGLTCGHSAVATCPDCLGEFCNNHAENHACLEIIVSQRTELMTDAAGRELPEILINAVPTPTPLPSPDDISAKAYQLLADIKSSGCAGIVIILGTKLPQVQLIGHGTNNSNAAETLREIASAVEGGGMVSELEFDLRPSAAN